MLCNHSRFKGEIKKLRQGRNRKPDQFTASEGRARTGAVGARSLRIMSLGKPVKRNRMNKIGSAFWNKIACAVSIPGPRSRCFLKALGKIHVSKHRSRALSPSWRFGLFLLMEPLRLRQGMSVSGGLGVRLGKFIFS